MQPINEEAEEKNKNRIQLTDLSQFLWSVNIRVDITNKVVSSSGLQQNPQRRWRDVYIADRNGCKIKARMWQRMADEDYEVGDIIQITNGYLNQFNNMKRISVSEYKSSVTVLTNEDHDEEMAAAEDITLSSVPAIDIDDIYHAHGYGGSVFQIRDCKVEQSDESMEYIGCKECKKSVRFHGNCTNANCSLAGVHDPDQQERFFKARLFLRQPQGRGIWVTCFADALANVIDLECSQGDIDAFNCQLNKIGRVNVVVELTPKFSSRIPHVTVLQITRSF